MTGGTYTLMLHLDTDTAIEVGALGTHGFDAGWYAYTGSALGPGGFARVDRHHELSAGERDTRQWHVDYLLGHPAVSIRADVRTPGADAECEIADALPDGPVAGFGASDCGCDSHLSFFADEGTAMQAVRAAHRER